MLDDEIQVREVSGSVVDIGDVEAILVQGPDGGPFVRVDVLDSELLALRQIAVGLGVGELPASGISLPPSSRESSPALIRLSSAAE